MANFLIGLLTAIAIAYLANSAHALNRGGAIAAAILGTVVFGLGGAAWALVLLTFFISSSGLSKVFRTQKARAVDDFSKSANRDAWQVLANGGVAGVATLAYVVLSNAQPASEMLPLLWVTFAGSLAGANADTWATELGVLNPRQPVLLTTFKRVPQGTSSGVSLVGTLAALAGSAGRDGGFPAGSHLASDLSLPGLRQADRKAPHTHLRWSDGAGAGALLVEQ